MSQRRPVRLRPETGDTTSRPLDRAWASTATTDVGTESASDISIELITVPEVARRLKLSKSKVYLLCQRGEIPAIQFGKSVRVPLHELDTWIRLHVRARLPPDP
jgi:excisionase family DNA binding protein